MGAETAPLCANGNKQLNLTGAMIGAEEAREIGLVERIYPAAELLGATRCGGRKHSDVSDR
jgi:enoyl-CoA hydratase/carnithine racemase